MAVVCDGHGGDSYVRSDVGSSIAVDIAKEKIIHFVESLPVDFFKNKRSAVSAMPLCDPRESSKGHRKETSELSESELDLLKQNVRYIKESQVYPDIEKRFRHLFKDIYESWKTAIAKDVQDRPFSKKEKEKIGALRIEKAYGTTLIAVVKTPDYWFAFQLGDGKLYACDELMRWTEPVPWDCNCFLNMTTSLCDKSPVEEFRYAFDGSGVFPIAFVLGSDGVDDTFVKQELIHKFYSNLLCVFNDTEKDEAINLLEKHLANLSERGSHDDMSVAAIIDESRLPKAIDYYHVISEVRALNSEKSKRLGDISQLEMEFKQLKRKITEKSFLRDEKARSVFMLWLKAIQQYREERNGYNEISNDVAVLKSKLEAVDCNLQKMKEDFKNWEISSRKRVGELKVEADNISKSVHTSEIPHEQGSEISDLICGKVNNKVLTDECIARMEKESEVQVKEILNIKK